LRRQTEVRANPRDPLGFYALLGLRPGASLAEVRTAWRRLVREAHPDAGGDPDHFRLLQEAYETLSDPLRRIAYDRLASGAPDGSGDPNAPSATPRGAAPPRRRAPGQTRAMRLRAVAGLVLAALAAGSWMVLRHAGTDTGFGVPSLSRVPAEPSPVAAEAAETRHDGEQDARVLYAVSLTFEPGAWQVDATHPPFRGTVVEGLAAALGAVVDREWWIEVEATSPKVVDEGGVALDDWELALARLAAVLDALAREGVPGERLGVRFSAGAAAELGALGTVELRLLCCRGTGGSATARLSAGPAAQDGR